MPSGGGATDALFGAGSGNALTQITKYAAGIFLGLCMVLSVMNIHRAGATRKKINEELLRQASTSSTMAKLPMAQAPAATNLVLTATNVGKLAVTLATNSAPAAAATVPPAAAPAAAPAK